MARPRADDYHEKQGLILDGAAALFARKGFAGTSIAQMAESCNSSKALIYHYYQSKESILFDMLKQHCQLLLDTAAQTMQEAQAPEEQLRLMLRAFMNIYVTSHAKHMVMLNDLHWLPKPQQDEIRDLEKQVVQYFRRLVSRIRPDLNQQETTAASMSLMGSINWTYIWFKEDGALTPSAFADLTASIFFEGIHRGAGKLQIS